MNTETTVIEQHAPVTATAAHPLQAVGTAIAGFDYLPRSMTEALEIARMLSESTMVPKDYIGKPGNVLVAMQFGHELGLKPLQAMQSLAVINGKPGLYGDAGKALLLSRGCRIVERDIAGIKEAGYVAECTIHRPGYPPLTRTFAKENAVTAKLWGKEGPWTNYPERQLAWRAFWFAARDAATDILRGIPAAEELRDIEIDITAIAAVERPRPQPKAADPAPVDTDTGEMHQRTAPQKNGDGDVLAPDSMKRLIERKCSDGGAAIDSMLKAHNATLDTLTVAQGNAILSSLRK